MANARKIAAKALLRVNRDKGYSNIVWDHALQTADLSTRDSALAAALFYGVLERRITLDYVLSLHSKMPLKKITPYVMECLRLGAYQLLYMDKIPASAAVNESVRLVKESKEGRASGFVNGVLRSLERAGSDIKWPQDPLQRMSVEYACPLPLLNHFLNYYGEDLTKHTLSAFLQRQKIYIRVNTLKTDDETLRTRLQEEGVTAHPTDLPHCLLLEQSGNLQRLPSFREGLFHVQDKASQLCVKALQAKEGMRVLDVCAAPGGKSFTIAQTMNGIGCVEARDLYPQRIGLIQDGARRLSLDCVHASVGDAGVFEPELGTFDRVLCDLPCSGLGIIGKKPEIRYGCEEPGYNLVTKLDNLSQRQYDLLCINQAYVKIGGVLVYSTCTLNPAENENNVRRFLKSHPQFAPFAILPQAPRGYQQPEHTLTLFPHIHGTDGFFLSAFVKLR